MTENGHKVSYGREKNILELSCGDGGTTVKNIKLYLLNG